MIGSTFRRVISADVETPNTSVVRLNTLRTFNAGSTRLTVQNIDAAETAQWGWSSGAAPTTGQMGILVPYQSIVFNWETKYLDNIYIKHGSATAKIYVMEEGI
jgi:hypothetical protein